jgi:hypothetical protein
MLWDKCLHWRLVAIVIALSCISACSGPIGEKFQDVNSIGMSKTWDDWVIVGRFGPNGPFELVEFKECEYSEPCSFSHDGTSHTYDKFYGYKLTILRLESDDGEVSHVVLRGKEKQYSTN